jgi:hypothetical protein
VGALDPVPPITEGLIELGGKQVGVPYVECCRKPARSATARNMAGCRIARIRMPASDSNSRYEPDRSRSTGVLSTDCPRIDPHDPDAGGAQILHQQTRKQVGGRLRRSGGSMMIPSSHSTPLAAVACTPLRRPSRSGSIFRATRRSGCLDNGVIA